MTAEMMDSKICSIMLLNEERQELDIAATQSLSEAYRKKPPLKIGQSISGLAVKERRPIGVLNVTRESNYMYSEPGGRKGRAPIAPLGSDDVEGPGHRCHQ